jgi:hypothetical protein
MPFDKSFDVLYRMCFPSGNCDSNDGAAVTLSKMQWQNKRVGCDDCCCGPYLLSIKKMNAQRDLKSGCSAALTVTLTSTTSPSFPASLCKLQEMQGGAAAAAAAAAAARHASLNCSQVRDIES